MSVELLRDSVARAERIVVLTGEEATAGCDLFLAVGTSLTVYPVARPPQIAVDAGARLVILNAELTPLDVLADVVLRGRAGEMLTAILRLSGSPAAN